MSADTAKTACSAILDGVLTRQEVAFMWGVRENTVTDNILRHKIVARQSIGGRWLISRASVIRAWGQPKNELPEDASWTGV